MEPTLTRYVFLLYAAILSLILYLDRICIATSAEYIEKELGLDKADISWVFSAFTLGYMLFEVPTGAWGDRYGAKRVLCRIVLWWSLFTVLTGCIWRFTFDSGQRLKVPLLGWEVPLLFDGFVLLLLVRFLFGAGEAGAYPTIAKCSSRWFPANERGRAQGIVGTAGRLGAGLSAGVTIAVALFVNQYLWPEMGWRVSFWLFGALGIVWVVFFAWWFRDSPADHPAVNAAELALIEGDRRAKIEDLGSHPPSSAHADVPWRALLTSVNLWVYSAMAFCSAFTVYLYFTHFPSYLKQRHAISEGWLSVAGLPMLLGAIGCTLGGVLTDWLVRRTGSRRWGRRTMGLIGKGGGALLLLAGASADSPIWAVVLISLSAFTSDLALAAHWAICTDAGGRFVGTVFGFMNAVAAVGGALSPVLAGYILEGLSPTDEAHHFDPVARAHAWDCILYMFGGALALGAIGWLRIDPDESMVG